MCTEDEHSYLMINICTSQDKHGPVNVNASCNYRVGPVGFVVPPCTANSMRSFQKVLTHDNSEIVFV